MDVAGALKTAFAGRYVIEHELGRGGMAVVYRASDLRHERPVAIKVLRPELSASLAAERFLREIHIAAQLQHPLIVPLYDSGATDQVVWFVMPCIEGESLRQRLAREHQLPLADALRIAREVAEALAYAHEHGVVHRDIKPENILLTQEHAIVADFGIARAISVAGGQDLTSAGTAIGTPAYMSPEQGSGAAVVDGRSDVYSLGCVLYEMLAGEPPFTGPTPQAVIARHLSERLPSLRIVRSAIPAGTEAVVGRALAKAAADRFATAAEFAAALDGAARVAGRPSSFVARHAGVAMLLLAVAALLASIARWRVPADGRVNGRRLVVYPLAIQGQVGPGNGMGEDVATALTTALNATQYLDALDGWPLLDENERQAVRRLTPVRERQATRRQGARFSVTGSILFADSLRVLVRLLDVEGDTTAQTTFALARSADAWTVGLRAAMDLMPKIIPSGVAIDLSSLSQRSLPAAAAFLRGEQAYRRAKFADAIGHYRAAVAADSTFGLAALRGAQAASWNRLLGEATELARTAANDSLSLPVRSRQLAHAMIAYLAGQADSAAHHLRRILATDPDWPEAWMMLGDVYTHLLPSGAAPDSMAELSFRTVYQWDSTFAPALYHLTEIAARRGDVAEASRLLDRFEDSEPDSVELVPLQLMVRCVRDPRAMDWNGPATRVPAHVFQAGRSLAVGGLHQPECAEGAWRAVLRHDSDGPRRWGALLGLQSLLVARGRANEVATLVESDTVFSGLVHGQLYVLDVMAGAHLRREGEGAASLLREAQRAGLGSPRLWYLATWELCCGSLEAGVALGDSLARRAARSRDRGEKLLAETMAARIALARGDSGTARELLAALRPTAGRQQVGWDAAESLAGERILLAELLLAGRQYAEALRVASSFDSPAVVPQLVFLPRALSIRVSAARALGREQAAKRFSDRLAELQRVP